VKMDWRGYWVASPTPFDSKGEIEVTSMERLISFYLSQKIHGIVVNGSSGEWCSQTVAERKLVAEISVNAVDQQIPIIIGASAYTAIDVIEISQHAHSIGANGVMITPPPYYNLTEQEILNFYQTIESQVSIPIMVYNWPRGVGVDMSERLIIQIAKLSQVAAIKESSGDEDKTYRVLKGLRDSSVDISFFARFIHPKGADVLRTLGGDGNIDGGGLGSIFAVKFYDAWEQKNFVSMDENSIAYSGLVSKLMNRDYSGKFGSPISQIKACMRILDQPGGYVRPPLMEIDDPALLRQLEDILVTAGLVR
jgi:dihydrodipicolinate synthase/N-acetylneuraminate lyase